MAQTPSELTPHVSLRAFFGAELRHWRQRAGLSHDRLGAQVNYWGDTIGKVEKAERAPSAQLAKACDRVLDTGGALARLVGLIDHLAQETRAIGPEAQVAAGNASSGPRLKLPPVGSLPNGPTVGAAAGSTARQETAVNRFEFIVSVFGAGAGAVVGSVGLAEPSRLGHDDVASWQLRLSCLYELDDQYGGAGGVYELALRSLRQLRRVLRRASYGPPTGDALQTIAGELTTHAGWLAFDAGWQAEARHWWLEASHAARLADDDRLFVGALRSMSRQASEQGQPREAIELAQAAQQAAKPWGTPRLHSNLLALEAFGHSRAGDERATWQAFHQAGTLLGAGRREDPSWLDFWDEADLACCEMRSARILGELPVAERCSRNTLAAVGPAYPRNRASYVAQRADVLVGARAHR